MTLPASPEYFVERLRTLHDRIQAALRGAQKEHRTAELARAEVARDGDTIYGIDIHAETILHEFCAEWSRELPFTLVAEGLPGAGHRTFPEGSPPGRASFLLLVDPIDGTRGLMYEKRSAWCLSGVAAPRSAGARLSDIVVAVQTELPTPRAALADQLWAVHGQGAQGETRDLRTGDRESFTPRPSGCEGLEHGFAAISKFFPGAKALAAEIEEALFEEVVGDPEDGNPLVFDDEYLSSGGQLYELAVGHDRFTADLRPVLLAALGMEGRRLCAHPYDLATEMIAREAGVEVADLSGQPLDAPLDIREDVTWVGYANAALRRRIEPVLARVVATRCAARRRSPVR